MFSIHPRPFSAHWFGAIGLYGLLFTLCLACITPFAAAAAFAPLLFNRGPARILMLALWVTNQVVGFTLLNYPFTYDCIAWGLAIGVSALLSLEAAFLCLSHIQHVRRAWLSPLLTFASAFITYQAALWSFSFFLPAESYAFSWPVIGLVLKVNALPYLSILSVWIVAQYFYPPTPTRALSAAH